MLISLLCFSQVFLIKRNRSMLLRWFLTKRSITVIDFNTFLLSFLRSRYRLSRRRAIWFRKCLRDSNARVRIMLNDFTLSEIHRQWSPSKLPRSIEDTLLHVLSPNPIRIIFSRLLPILLSRSDKRNIPLFVDVRPELLSIVTHKSREFYLQYH